MNNYTHYKVWDEITYQFANFKQRTVEVWELISNFIQYFTVYVIVIAYSGLNGLNRVYMASIC